MFGQGVGKKFSEQMFAFFANSCYNYSNKVT
jgi:hypothetical protein